MTKLVGIRELKANFSKLIRDAEQGNEVLVTRDGEPVAKLIPFKVKKKTKAKYRQPLT